MNTQFSPADLHPGRGKSREQIRCVLCDWTPNRNASQEAGGVRWKMLAKHYETHIDHLTGGTPAEDLTNETT